MTEPKDFAEMIVDQQVGLRPLPTFEKELAEVRVELATVKAEIAPLLAQLQWVGEAIEGLDVSEFAESFPLVRAVADLRNELATVKAERDEAREIVAKVNNEVIGSYGYFTEPSCVKAVQDLKIHSNQQWAELTRIVGEVQRLQPAGSPPPGDALILVRWIVIEAAKELTRLRGYVQHKPECEHVKGVRYLHSNDWGEQSYRWDTTGKHVRKPRCTCGLRGEQKQCPGYKDDSFAMGFCKLCGETRRGHRGEQKNETA